MAEKNVILKDGEDILYPKTLLSLVDGMPQPTSADNGKMLGVEDGAYKIVEGGGGSTKYLHHVNLRQSDYTSSFTVLLITDSATPMTAADLRDELLSNGSDSYDEYYPASGWNDTNYPVIGAFNNQGNLSVIRAEPNFGGRTVTQGLLSWIVTDIVSQL